MRREGGVGGGRTEKASEIERCHVLLSAFVSMGLSQQ